jgi:hypothetical protein
MRPVHNQQVNVHVQVQRRAKALHQRHRAGGTRGARRRGPLQQETRDRAVRHIEHLCERGRVRRQQEAQRIRQRQRPLAQRPLGQHLIDQQRRGVSHAARTARGAEPAPLAAERDELLGVSHFAAYAPEPVLGAATFHVGPELLLDMLRQRPAGLTAQCAERRIVPLDELIQQRRLGPVAGVPMTGGTEQAMPPCSAASRADPLRSSRSAGRRTDRPQ